jgi:hypothetical protein
MFVLSVKYHNPIEIFYGWRSRTTALKDCLIWVLELVQNGSHRARVELIHDLIRSARQFEMRVLGMGDRAAAFRNHDGSEQCCTRAAIALESLTVRFEELRALGHVARAALRTTHELLPLPSVKAAMRTR